MSKTVLSKPFWIGFGHIQNYLGVQNIILWNFGFSTLVSSIFSNHFKKTFISWVIFNWYSYFLEWNLSILTEKFLFKIIINSIQGSKNFVKLWRLNYKSFIFKTAQNYVLNLGFGYLRPKPPRTCVNNYPAREVGNQNVKLAITKLRIKCCERIFNKIKK